MSQAKQKIKMFSGIQTTEVLCWISKHRDTEMWTMTSTDWKIALGILLSEHKVLTYAMFIQLFSLVLISRVMSLIASVQSLVEL